jgi:hypothetical protein
MKYALRSLLITFSFVGLAAIATASGRRHVRDVSPTELFAEVSGRVVTVMVKDGSEFQAQLIHVSDQAMRVKVTKSDPDKNFVAGSEREVNFSDLGTIDYVVRQGKSRWILPAVVGALGGTAFFTTRTHCVNNDTTHCPNYQIWAGVVAAGTTAAAAFGAHRMGRVEVQLHVVPPSESNQ